MLKSTKHVQILQKLKQNSDATTSKMPHPHTHTHKIKELEDLEPRSYSNNSKIYIWLFKSKINVPIKSNKF